MAEEKNISPDLQQIRNILFGEQASQIEDRFAALEQNINALRRETRQLRQALEVEATARTEADHALNQDHTLKRDAALSDLIALWLESLASEQADQREQGDRLAAALEAYRQAQDGVTAQLIAHLRGEQQQRAEQFAALRQALVDNLAGQDQVMATLTATLNDFRARHITPPAAVL